MKAPWSMLPALPLATGMAMGIVVAHCVGQWQITPFMALLCVAGLIGMLLPRLRYFMLLMVAMCLGWLGACMLACPQAPIQKAHYDVRAEINQVRHHNGVYNILFTVDSIATPADALGPVRRFKCQGRVDDAIYENPLPGERVAISALLTPITPDSIDAYQTYLYASGVRAMTQGYITNINKVGDEKGLTFALARYRLHLQDVISHSRIDDDVKAFLYAVVLGDAYDLKPEVKRDFRAAGIGHILALSGMHVGIIAMLLIMALLPLRVLTGRRWQYAIVLCLLWAYAMLTGLSPSVLRATIMATLVMGAVIVRRTPIPLNSLCVAAVIILAIDPTALFQAGFQLSFAAVAGILLFGEALNPYDATTHHRRWVVAQWLTVPMGAMLGTGIVTAYWFGYFPVWVLVLNVALCWIMPAVLCVGIVLLLCLLSHTPCGALKWLATALYKCMAVPAHWVVSLPGSQLMVPQPSIWGVACYFIALAFLWCALRYKRVGWWCACLLALAAFVMTA